MNNFFIIIGITIVVCFIIYMILIFEDILAAIFPPRDGKPILWESFNMIDNFHLAKFINWRK